MLRFNALLHAEKDNIIRVGGLYMRPKSVCAVEMTMYVLHLICVNRPINRKDVHA